MYPTAEVAGSSGPFGDNYSVIKECEDVAALVEKTGTQNIFGAELRSHHRSARQPGHPESSQCRALRAGSLCQRINPRIVGASIRTGNRGKARSRKH